MTPDDIVDAWLDAQAAHGYHAGVTEGLARTPQWRIIRRRRLMREEKRAFLRRLETTKALTSLTHGAPW